MPASGTTARILRIDLALRESWVEELPRQVPEAFIGGRGLGAYLAWTEIEPAIEPLSGRNKVIFSAGPLTGTPLPTSARCVAVTKSPLTGGYLYTVAGGLFGVNLRRAGYDALIIQSTSDEPVAIQVSGSEVLLKSAAGIWGHEASPAMETLRNEVGSNACIAAIGPAGERGVRFAGVMTSDLRQFGRGGLGAVMGALGVKAIAIQSTGKVRIHDRTAFNDCLVRVAELLRESPGSPPGFPRYGSGIGVAGNSWAGFLPTRNWSESTFGDAERLCTIAMRDEMGLVVGDRGCGGCPIKCSKVMKVTEGPHAGATCEGPEYETLYALGSNIGIGDPEFVIAANSLCDELGLDTISCGVVLGFAMECFEKGILTESDLNGRPLTFGDQRGALMLIEDIAHRRGIGDLLAEGTRRASERIGQGSEAFAMHVKGMEMGGYDPRGLKGQAITFAAGNRGGCHHSIGLVGRAEVENGTRLQLQGKGEFVRKAARARIIQDSTTNCTFAFPVTFDVDLWTRLHAACTGMHRTSGELVDCADRINTLERLFNLREGFSHLDDRLPARLMTEPLPDGPASGEVVSAEQLNELLGQYYSAMGWDAHGRPDCETLDRLGLGALVRGMDRRGEALIADGRRREEDLHE